MITIVLSNRNRDLRIVKKCLDSLSRQSNANFELFLVDYGSEAEYSINLEKLLLEYSKVKFIKCPVQGQLWNKSRAINIVLKQTINPYFLVADIDMIFRDDFLENLQTIKSQDQVVYFQVGFLSEAESQKEKNFEDYKINHFSSVEATGISIFPTNLLKSINGYDEFYHGWGAEDTDVHSRLKNAGHKVNFYNNDVFLLHQWHPKKYRSKESTEPFHTKLERINHSYIQISEKNKQTAVNLDTDWGVLPNEAEYIKLEVEPDIKIQIQQIDFDVNAVIAQLSNYKNKLIFISIINVSFSERLKKTVKKIVGKKYHNYLKMEDINNRLLEEIIFKNRNKPYLYSYQITGYRKQIDLKILL